MEAVLGFEGLRLVVVRDGGEGKERRGEEGGWKGGRKMFDL